MIYFISNRRGYYNVWGIRFDPVSGKPVGEAFRVTNWEGPGQMISPQIGAIAMALTTNQLFLPITEASGNVWMLENVITPSLKRGACSFPCGSHVRAYDCAPAPKVERSVDVGVASMTTTPTLELKLRSAVGFSYMPTPRTLAGSVARVNRDHLNTGEHGF